MKYTHGGQQIIGIHLWKFTSSEVNNISIATTTITDKVVCY